MVEHVIFVRYYGGTYIARASGKQASCTAGQKPAAEAVARKLFGTRLFTLKTVNHCAYIATEEGNHET
jgi:hypothetical protein